MASKWFPFNREPKNSTKLRIFCFHWAGASASGYRQRPFRTSFPDDVELVPVQLPGRFIQYLNMGDY